MTKLPYDRITIIIVIIGVTLFIVLIEAWFDKVLKRRNDFSSEKSNGDLESAIIYFEHEEYVKAKEELDLLIVRHPQYAEAYWRRYLIHYALEDNQAALQDINKAIELQPKRSSIIEIEG